MNVGGLSIMIGDSLSGQTCDTKPRPKSGIWYLFYALTNGRGAIIKKQCHNILERYITIYYEELSLTSKSILRRLIAKIAKQQQIT